MRDSLTCVNNLHQRNTVFANSVIIAKIVCTADTDVVNSVYTEIIANTMFVNTDTARRTQKTSLKIHGGP